MWPYYPSYFPASTIWPMAGQLPAWNDGCDDDDDEPFTSSGRGPARKHIKRLQKMGLIGPLIEAPGMGPNGAVSLPPWMAPGFRPQGGFDFEQPAMRAAQMFDYYTPDSIMRDSEGRIRKCWR